MCRDIKIYSTNVVF